MVSTVKQAGLRFGRRFALALGVTMGVIVVAAVVSIAGIQITGSVGAWHQWLDQHWVHLLLWRLCLYGLVAYAWWRMRKRLRYAGDSADLRVRLRRAEISAVCAVALLESMTWIQRS